MDVMFLMLELVQDGTAFVAVSEPIRMSIEECFRQATEVNMIPFSESPFFAGCFPDMESIQNTVQS